MDQRNFLYMFYGFAAAWAVLLVFVIGMVLRESRLRKEVENLKRMVGEHK